MCTALPREALCVLHCLERHCVHANRHDRTITVILAKHCIKLPDDGSLVIRNMLEHFKIFLKYFIIILILSTNYIFVHLLDNKVFYVPLDVTLYVCWLFFLHKILSFLNIIYFFRFIKYLGFNNNYNIYLLQLGCHPVAVVILHVYKI